MAKRATIHAFASKWQQLFATGQIQKYAQTLGQDCAKAGFALDQFAALTPGDTKLPLSSDLAATTAFLQAAQDVQALGNGIYSMWQQVTYWHTNDALTAPVNRHWFETALARLVGLTQPLGEITKVTIASDDCTWGLAPDPARVISQVLTIQVDGTVALDNEFASGYLHRETVQVPAANILPLMPQFEALADPDVPHPVVVDVGQWSLTVVGAGGSQTSRGPLIELADLSETIRDLLPFPHLLLFDGAPDVVQRLIAEYQPTPQTHEKLVIDRRSQSLSLTQRNGKMRSRIAIADETITDLLDDLPLPQTDLLPPRPREQHNLTVTLRYRDAQTQTLQGTLQLDQCIPQWRAIAAELREWLQERAPQMLDDRLISRTIPQFGDLLYAQVVFHHGARPYSYLADPELAVGDRVVVPVGSGERYGTIVAMAYYQPAQAPYPPAQTKRITCIADPIEEAEYDE
ncbi:hypothetical protein [Lacticaseibacillus jixiensis]|uniref:hypothetical protein n=1 Tax=Lacticaseibacillus jixiensis TaxID=3231926 RepID=UPI0036F3C166